MRYQTGMTDAALLGLIASGCRLLFATPDAWAARGPELELTKRRLALTGGRMLTAQSDGAAVQMAAGAVLAGQAAAAVVLDSAMGAVHLHGVSDLPVVLVDVSGRLPLGMGEIRLLVAPPTPGYALEAGSGIAQWAKALQGPALLAGLGDEVGEASLPPPGSPEGLLPLLQSGPDDPDLLLLSSGSTYEACRVARQRLERMGPRVGHVHLVQLEPFPGALVAPVITSARRVLVVEPGGPGTLAGLVRSHLGAPVHPFGELPRLTESPLGSAEVLWRAGEVLTL